MAFVHWIHRLIKQAIQFTYTDRSFERLLSHTLRYIYCRTSLEFTFNVFDRVDNAWSVLMWSFVATYTPCVSRSSFCDWMSLSRWLFLYLMLVLPLLRNNMLVFHFYLFPLFYLESPYVFLRYCSSSCRRQI